jgi:hypothetical protein
MQRSRVYDCRIDPSILLLAIGRDVVDWIELLAHASISCAKHFDYVVYSGYATIQLNIEIISRCLVKFIVSQKVKILNCWWSSRYLRRSCVDNIVYYRAGFMHKHIVNTSLRRVYRPVFGNDNRLATKSILPLSFFRVSSSGGWKWMLQVWWRGTLLSCMFVLSYLTQVCPSFPAIT